MLSRLVGVQTIEQSNGDLSVFSATGLNLPTRGGDNPFSIPSASTTVGSYYPGGGIPGIMLGGTDVTSQMSGGQIGADIALRDNILPTDQSELDEFAQGLSSRFAGQGLSLFTDPSGNVPSGGGSPVQAGYVGYSGTIQVNPVVIANPSLVRDGTNSVASVGFTPNPSGGPAGFTGLITNIVNYTFGTQIQTGTAQPDMNTTGLGASGTLTAPFNAAADTLASFATSLVSAQSQQSATVTGNLSTEQALQTSLNSKISSTSGVNMDTEMTLMLSLQNAYAANARIINAVQTMLTQLMQAVQ